MSDPWCCSSLSKVMLDEGGKPAYLKQELPSSRAHLLQNRAPTSLPFLHPRRPFHAKLIHNLKHKVRCWTDLRLSSRRGSSVRPESSDEVESGKSAGSSHGRGHRPTGQEGGLHGGQVVGGVLGRVG